MGYFSSGTEGMDYQAQWCVRCVHDADPLGCEVWNAHLEHNYDECNNEASILHDLIPRSDDGLRNGRCRMFIEAKLI